MAEHVRPSHNHNFSLQKPVDPNLCWFIEWCKCGIMGICWYWKYSPIFCCVYSFIYFSVAWNLFILPTVRSDIIYLAACFALILPFCWNRQKKLFHSSDRFRIIFSHAHMRISHKIESYIQNEWKLRWFVCLSISAAHPYMALVQLELLHRSFQLKQLQCLPFANIFYWNANCTCAGRNHSELSSERINWKTLVIWLVNPSSDTQDVHPSGGKRNMDAKKAAHSNHMRFQHWFFGSESIGGTSGAMKRMEFGGPTSASDCTVVQPPHIVLQASHSLLLFFSIQPTGDDVIDQGEMTFLYHHVFVHISVRKTRLETGW